MNSVEDAAFSLQVNMQLLIAAAVSDQYLETTAVPTLKLGDRDSLSTTLYDVEDIFTESVPDLVGRLKRLLAQPRIDVISALAIFDELASLSGATLDIDLPWERDGLLNYVEAPRPFERDPDQVYVFLAGGISHCPFWQTKARHHIHWLDSSITVVNPRRLHFDLTDPHASTIQIDWESAALLKADVVMFWFPQAPSDQPIALLELGSFFRGDTPIAVGVEAGYSRAFDVRQQLKNARPDVTVRDSLDDTIQDAITLISRLERPKSDQ